DLLEAAGERDLAVDAYRRQALTLEMQAARASKPTKAELMSQAGEATAKADHMVALARVERGLAEAMEHWHELGDLTSDHRKAAEGYEASERDHAANGDLAEAAKRARSAARSHDEHATLLRQWVEQLTDEAEKNLSRAEAAKADDRGTAAAARAVAHETF